MSKPVRIKVVKQSQPDMRKLARALLRLVAQQQGADAPADGPDGKAS